MRLLAECAPRHLAATALTLFGTVGNDAATTLLRLASSPLYASFGAHGFGVMAALCAAARPSLGRCASLPANPPDLPVFALATDSGLFTFQMAEVAAQLSPTTTSILVGRFQAAWPCPNEGIQHGFSEYLRSATPPDTPTRVASATADCLGRA
jgi:hypothetical protein